MFFVLKHSLGSNCARINSMHKTDEYSHIQSFKLILFTILILLSGSNKISASGGIEESNPALSKLQPDPQLQHWILETTKNLLGQDFISQMLLEELETMKVQAPAMYKYHETNHNLYKDMAMEGHPDVMTLLAANFHFGRGVNVNPVKALRWFIQSAEKDNLQSQIATGLYLLSGRALQRDLSQAKYWLERAHRLGSQLAGEILQTTGNRLDSNTAKIENISTDVKSSDKVTNVFDIPKDLSKSKTELEKINFNPDTQITHNQPSSSIDQLELNHKKDLKSLVRLGDIYISGNGVKRDKNKAMQFYERAAERNSSEAQLKLGLIKLEFEGESENDRSEGLSYLRAAAENGSVEAQKIYAEEMLHKKKFSIAAKYLEQSATQGDVDSMVSLAELGSQQSSKSHDIDSVYWYLQAALKGHHEAQYESGMLYMGGKHVPQDFRLAYRWLLLAAQKGHKNAQFQLGVLYSKGLGIPKNDYRAAKWYLKAAKQAHRDAAAILGTLFYDGKGVAQDFEKALHWFTKAAQQGDSEIQELLVKLYRGQMQISPNYVKAYAWANVLAENYEEHRNDLDGLKTYLSVDELKDAQELSLNHYAKIQKNLLIVN